MDITMKQNLDVGKFVRLITIKKESEIVDVGYWTEMVSETFRCPTNSGIWTTFA